VKTGVLKNGSRRRRTQDRSARRCDRAVVSPAGTEKSTQEWSTGRRRSLAGFFSGLGLSRLSGSIEPFGDEVSNAYLAEVIEERADLLGCAVDVVVVLVEEGREHFWRVAYFMLFDTWTWARLRILGARSVELAHFWHREQQIAPRTRDRLPSRGAGSRHLGFSRVVVAVENLDSALASYRR